MMSECFMCKELENELEEMEEQKDAVSEKVSALQEEVKRLREALDLAWGLIANASGSDWKKESLEWQEAAARWRDNYYLLSSPSNLSKVAETKEFHKEEDCTVDTCVGGVRCSCACHDPDAEKEAGE